MRAITRSSFFGICVLSAAFQLLAADTFSIAGIRPDVMLCVVVFFGFFGDTRAGLKAGIALGCVRDVFGTDLFGVHIALLALIGWFAQRMKVHFFWESRLFQAIAAFLASLLYSTALFFLQRIAGMSHEVVTEGISEFGIFCTHVSLPAALYTTLVCLILAAAFTRIFRPRSRFI